MTEIERIIKDVFSKGNPQLYDIYGKGLAQAIQEYIDKNYIAKVESSYCKDCEKLPIGHDWYVGFDENVCIRCGAQLKEKLKGV
jgi:uncharacterized paraquat-inducible protein A